MSAPEVFLLLLRPASGARAAVVHLGLRGQTPPLGTLCGLTLPDAIRLGDTQTHGDSDCPRCDRERAIRTRLARAE